MRKFQLDRILFFASLLLSSFAYGMVSTQNEWFPYREIQSAIIQTQKLFSRARQKSTEWYYIPARSPVRARLHRPDAMAPGLTLVAAVAHEELSIKVVDAHGEPVHAWRIDYQKLWPRSPHL